MSLIWFFVTDAHHPLIALPTSLALAKSTSSTSTPNKKREKNVYDKSEMEYMV